MPSLGVVLDSRISMVGRVVKTVLSVPKINDGIALNFHPINVLLGK